MIWWTLRGDCPQGWVVIPMGGPAVRNPAVWQHVTWLIQQRLGDDVKWSIKPRRRKL